MAKQAKARRAVKNRNLDHDALIRRGLELHEARKYSAALPWFERALLVAPKCPAAMYNRANTLHMLDRDSEAEPLLRSLIQATPEELREGCPASQPRSLQLDAHFLLSQVLLYGRGFSDEAFALATKHLRMRRRGLHSVWTAREVRRRIAELRREWEDLPTK
jgi:tetratricopeptide (TPR) repeat protein